MWKCDRIITTSLLPLSLVILSSPLATCRVPQVVAAEVADLKTRLGLVEDPGFKVDWTAVQTLVRESLVKIRTGVSFYVMGAKLLASDLQVRGVCPLSLCQQYTPRS